MHVSCVLYCHIELNVIVHCVYGTAKNVQRVVVPASLSLHSSSLFKDFALPFYSLFFFGYQEEFVKKSVPLIAHRGAWLKMANRKFAVASQSHAKHQNSSPLICLTTVRTSAGCQAHVLPDYPHSDRGPGPRHRKVWRRLESRPSPGKNGGSRVRRSHPPFLRDVLRAAGYVS